MPFRSVSISAIASSVCFCSVVSARRFRIADAQVRDVPSPHRYLAIYEIETDDPQRFARELLARAGTELLATSPALAPDASAYLWEPVE